MAGDCFTADDAVDFSTKDTLRFQGQIAKALAENSPYLDVLEGGVFPSGVSEEIRTVVQLPAAPGDSLIEPTFVNDSAIAGTFGEQDAVSTHEFTYRLKSMRGRGPRVNVKQGYAAFKESYSAAEDSMKKLITQYLNADIKINLVKLSGTKFVANATAGFYNCVTGGEYSDLGTNFKSNLAPNAPITLKALTRLSRFLREELLGEAFGSGEGKFVKVIAGAETIENLRNEASTGDILRALTTGRYGQGESALTGYSWETSTPFRGIGLATDQSPLRASAVVGGVPTYVNAWEVVDAGGGKKYRRRPTAWKKAPYEVLLMLGQGSFARLVPERYSLGGSFKFAPQLWSGDLEWHYAIDNDCNQFGDFGWHKYQITRAYKPMRPQHAIAVIFARCSDDLGLAGCSSTAGLNAGTVSA